MSTADEKLTIPQVCDELRSRDVKIWNIETRWGKRKTSYRVTWFVTGERFDETAGIRRADGSWQGWSPWASPPRRSPSPPSAAVATAHACY